MTIRTLLYFFLFPLIVISFGCAKQTSPTGGPKDSIPPLLTNSFPKQNEINFKGDRIELEFDELINLDNPKDQILITPDINKNFKIVTKKKRVILSLEEKLKENTTYSFNFRESVKDITEKNPATNLKLAFSTGTYIDSLSIQGKVINPLINKEVKDATVALYESDTFNIFKHRPSYVTKTNDKGLYKIENLKHGVFYLYTFDDTNDNLIVDSKNESYGFSTKRIELEANAKDENLNIINLDTRPLKLTSARPYNTYFNIKFSKGIKDYELKTENGDSLQSIFSDDHANIKIYKTFPQDSIKANISAIDSINQKIDSAFFVKFITKKTTPETFQVTMNTAKVIEDKATIEVSLKYNKPVRTINYDSVVYQIDSMNAIHFSAENFRWDIKNKTVSLSQSFDKKILKEKAKQKLAQVSETQPKAKPKPLQSSHAEFQLLFGKGAFISVESDSSQGIAENLKPSTIDQTGIIKVNIQTKEPAYIVQLLNTKFEIIASVKNKKQISFEDLTPGDYQLRLILDTNKDGVWSPGNILNREETERIVYFLNEKKNSIISLKANWEIGPLLISF
jgi:hypothetical protein